MVIPAVTVWGDKLLNSPNEHWDISNAATMAAGATLATIWVTVWEVLLLARSRRDPVGKGVLATTFIGTSMLFAGFGSVALASWEEVAAGQALPIINLFMFLIPLGLVVVFVAFVVLLVRGKPEEQQSLLLSGEPHVQ